MYPFVAKITFWDDSEVPWVKKTTNILLYAKSFSEACGQVEDYVNALEDVHIYCVGDSITYFEVPTDVANFFIKGEGNYEEGVLKNELDS